MPNIDPIAKTWEIDLANRVGRAVQMRRKALKLTAQQLAQRTADLGYPVTRVAISKIEGGLRAGKLDVAEVLVLAAALDMPPILLLFPDFPDGPVENLPGRKPTISRNAALWFSGQVPSENVGLRGDYVWNPGEELVNADDLATATDAELRQLQLDLTRILAAKDLPEVTEQIRRDIDHHEKLSATLRASAKRNIDELWGKDE
jgi:transcriptional regulator with XRE-family HTH domain